MGATLLATTHAAQFDPLTWLVVVPAIGAAVVALLPSRRTDQLKQVALLFSIVSGALSVYVLAVFHTHHGGFQFVVNDAWIKAYGIGWHLGVDGISLLMLLLTGIMFPIAIVAVRPEHSAKQYYAWMLLLMAGSMGVFMALDLMLFFVFFEIVLVPMYFLIGIWGHGDRVYVANKFFLYTMFGSTFMLVGVLATAFLHRSASGGPLTFDLVKIATDQSIGTNTTRWIFLAFAMGFAVKVPLVPFHTWLPDAHTEAPTAGSVILAGILLKFGTYGYIRFGLYLFPKASKFFAPLMLTLAVLGILYGAVCSAMQKDLKRVVAYSSVAHLGFIVLGTFALTVQSLDGAVYQMLNHGISTPALFLLIGMLYERRHTRKIGGTDGLAGLQTPAPILAGFFMVVMLSSIGLPGLNGFVGEFLILLGSFEGARWWAVIGASGVILAALYLLWAYQRVFHGKPVGDNKTMRDLTLGEGLVMSLLVAIIVFCGVYPKPLLDRITPSVKELVTHVSEHAKVDTSDLPPAAAASRGGEN